MGKQCTCWMCTISISGRAMPNSRFVTSSKQQNLAIMFLNSSLVHTHLTGVCVHTALTAYLGRTLNIRGKETKLLITLKAPHKGISRDTLRRWVKDALSNAGIDLGIFAPHSTRSASTSMAVNNKVPLPTLIRAAGWYSESTFSKYYNKPISSVFGDHVLGGHGNS